MKIFLVGDYRTGTGPANVTLAYKERLEDVTVQNRQSKLMRLPELLIKTMQADVVLLSGHSKQNLWAIRFANCFHKKVAFLMHGCVEQENAINGVPDEDMNRTERATMAGSDAIIAVSERFSNWLKEHYPEYADKISAVPNGVDFEKLSEINTATTKLPHRILSIGGGMPRKMIRYICKAIEILRQDSEYADTELVVIGDKGLDDLVIDSYPFVDNRNLVPFSETEKLFASSALFVQNSCFETFGLAPLEALVHGTDVLLSAEIGALELFGRGDNGLRDEDIIYHYDDPKEIAEKIKLRLKESNNKRLLEAIDKESASWEKRTALLQEKLQLLVNSIS